MFAPLTYSPHIELTYPIESGHSNYYEEVFNSITLNKRLRYNSRVPNNTYFVSRDGISNTKVTYLTNEISFKTKLLPSYYSKNLGLLNRLFQKELTSSGNSDRLTQTTFENTAMLLAELPFTNAAVESTNSKSIRFSFVFPNNKLLLISKTLETLEDLEENEIIFSFFINRELIISNAAKISVFVEGFKQLLSL